MTKVSPKASCHFHLELICQWQLTTSESKCVGKRLVNKQYFGAIIQDGERFDVDNVDQDNTDGCITFHEAPMCLTDIDISVSESDISCFSFEFS